jgi:hypothetical protein
VSTDPLARTILEDLAAGDTPIALSRAAHLPELMVNGRAHHASWLNRAARRGFLADGGARVKLETTKLGKMVTTRSAVARFLHRLRSSQAEPFSDSLFDEKHLKTRSHMAAEAALARDGI